MEQLSLSKSPDEVVWRQVYGLLALCGIGFTLCGIGFTMSLFIGSLALEGVEAQTILLMIEPEFYHDHSYRRSEV